MNVLTVFCLQVMILRSIYFGKVVPVHASRQKKSMTRSRTAIILNLGARWKFSASRFGRFTPGKSVSDAYDWEWVWTFEDKSVSPAGIRFPGFPARSVVTILTTRLQKNENNHKISQLTLKFPCQEWSQVLSAWAETVQLCRLLTQSEYIESARNGICLWELRLEIFFVRCLKHCCI
jgi:hypothetical protein